MNYKHRKIDDKAPAYERVRAECDYEAKRAMGGRFNDRNRYDKLEAWLEIFSACARTKGYEIYGVDYY